MKYWIEREEKGEREVEVEVVEEGGGSGGTPRKFPYGRVLREKLWAYLHYLHPFMHYQKHIKKYIKTLLFWHFKFEMLIN